MTLRLRRAFHNVLCKVGANINKRYLHMSTLSTAQFSVLTVQVHTIVSVDLTCEWFCLPITLGCVFGVRTNLEIGN